MNRHEFMKNLEELLLDLPAAERDEALSYYNDYLDDAGPENEGAILEKLESPEKVAKIIRAGMENADDTAGEFTELGYEDIRFTKEKAIPDIRHGVPAVSKQKVKDEEEKTSSQSKNTDGYYGSHRYKASDKSSQKTDSYDYNNMNQRRKILLIVVLCLIAIPVGIPLVTGLFGGFSGILIALITVFAGLGIAGAALVIAGIAVAFIGFVKMLVLPGAGLLVAGAGLMIAALGIIAFTVFVWFIGHIVPKLFRFISRLLKRLFNKGRNAV